MSRPSPIERASQLADEGDYSGVAGIRLTMLKDGYNVDQLYGPQLMRQLRDRCGRGWIWGGGKGLQDAASVAGILTATEAAVADGPRRPRPQPCRAGGMGGMAI